MKKLKKAIKEWEQVNQLFDLGLIDFITKDQKRKEILKRNLGILI